MTSSGGGIIIIIEYITTCLFIYSASGVEITDDDKDDDDNEVNGHIYEVKKIFEFLHDKKGGFKECQGQGKGRENNVVRDTATCDDVKGKILV